MGSRAVAKTTLGFDPPYPPWGMVPFVRRGLKQVSASSGLLPSVHATAAISTWGFSIGLWSLEGHEATLQLDAWCRSYRRPLLMP